MGLGSGPGGFWYDFLRQLTVFFFLTQKKQHPGYLHNWKIYPCIHVNDMHQAATKESIFFRYNAIFPVPNISKSLYDLSDKHTMISVFSYQCFQKLHVVDIFPFVNIQIWAKRWSSQKLEILNTMFIVIWLIKTNHFRDRLESSQTPPPTQPATL